ncbi:MAG: biopolymer transporter ExbD [Planctomycetota bacterium]
MKADEAIKAYRKQPRHSRKPDKGGMNLNLTSMIDVIFLLLVYFVVTASFAENEGVLTARLPQKEGQTQQTKDTPPPTQPLRIILRSTGQAGVDISVPGASRVGTFSELQATLDRLMLDPERGKRDGIFEPDHPVLIQPDGQVRWDYVVNAFNAAIAARFSNVRFVPVEEGA